MEIRSLKDALERGDVETLQMGMVDVVDMHIKADLLATAIKLGRNECIDCLLRCGADPFLKQSDTRRTGLYWAILKDNLDALQLLLRDIHRDPVEVVLETSSLTTGSVSESLVRARSKPRNLNFAGAISPEYHQSDLSYRTRRAMDEALFEAASLGSTVTAQFLIKNGANPNTFCYHDDEFLSWCSPLVAACYIPFNSFSHRSDEDAVSMVRLLVENGAEIAAKNYVGDTAMHWAAASSLQEVVLILLRNGADINAKNQLGCTPIMMAIEKNSSGCYDTVQILLEWGASVNDIDNSAWSTLCYAVNNQNCLLTELLLERGASTNYDILVTPNIVVTTNPLFIATTLNNRQLIKLLISYEADVNRKAGSVANPMSPFASCLQMSNFELAGLFLDLGSDRHEAFDCIQRNHQQTLEGIPDSMVEYLSTDKKIRLNSLEKLSSVLMTPVRLMSMCRAVIRSHVLCRRIGELPLPTALKSYLQFDDIF